MLMMMKMMIDTEHRPSNSRPKRIFRSNRGRNNNNKRLSSAVVVATVFVVLLLARHHGAADAFSSSSSWSDLPQQRRAARLDESSDAKHPHDLILPLRMASSSSTDQQEQQAESEVERLLRKARELREQAARAEQQVHTDLVSKRQEQEIQMDGMIEYLFPTETDPSTGDDVVSRLKAKKVSKETLEKIFDRLDDRLMVAEGQEHVCATTSGDAFERVKKPRDEKQIECIQRRIEVLLGAVEVLDQEFRNAHASTVTGSQDFGLYAVTATEHTHWGGGQLRHDLESRLKEKQRERHGQYQKRQQELRDAQTVKPHDNRKPPTPKAKDDHGFLP
jgi:hypothetical protein